MAKSSFMTRAADTMEPGLAAMSVFVGLVMILRYRKKNMIPPKYLFCRMLLQMNWA